MFALPGSAYATRQEQFRPNADQKITVEIGRDVTVISSLPEHRNDRAAARSGFMSWSDPVTIGHGSDGTGRNLGKYS